MHPFSRPTKPPISIGLVKRHPSARYLNLIGFLTALVMASEANAEGLLSKNYYAGVFPVSVAVADLDGDSAPDLVTANVDGDDVSVLLGAGDGTVRFLARFAVVDGPFSVAAADLDGDTVPDLATANFYSDDVSVLLGNGDGTFQAAASFAAGDAPGFIAVADFDRDSVPDLVAANVGTDDVSVLLGNGDGTFQAAVAFAVGNQPRALAVADLNSDTLLDVVTTNAVSDDVSVLLGNGDGTFQAAASFAAGDIPRWVAVADLDRDEIPDLVTANFRSSDVHVLLGNGDGTFRAPVAFAAGGGPFAVAVANIDGDTTPDIVTANLDSEDVSVLPGNGDGTFQAATAYWAGFDPQGIAVTDLNGDGAPDVVTANGSSHNVTVLTNLWEPAAHPKIDIKPGNDVNRINPSSRGTVSVAILGAEGFDVTDIDTMTLAFGPEGAHPAHAVKENYRDLDGDNFPDLLTQFRVNESGIEIGDTESCLRGKTHDGLFFEGCAAIQTVPHYAVRRPRRQSVRSPHDSGRFIFRRGGATPEPAPCRWQGECWCGQYRMVASPQRNSRPRSPKKRKGLK
jgi:hypothetical protein